MRTADELRRDYEAWWLSYWEVLPERHVAEVKVDYTEIEEEQEEHPWSSDPTDQPYPTEIEIDIEATAQVEYTVLRHRATGRLAYCDVYVRELQVLENCLLSLGNAAGTKSRYADKIEFDMIPDDRYLGAAIGISSIEVANIELGLGFDRWAALRYPAPVKTQEVTA